MTTRHYLSVIVAIASLGFAIYSYSKQSNAVSAGEHGKDGLDGKNGTNGLNGRDGINGTNGLNGRDGINGTNGLNGRDGISGTNGLNGRDGINGTNGLNGRDGINGTNGRDGRDGINGTNGRDGRDGINGTNGRDGRDGINGTNGLNGTVGPTGLSGTSFGFIQTYAQTTAIGVNAGSSTANSWTTWPLNTNTGGNMDGVYTQLASSTITVQAGTYLIHGRGVARTVNTAQFRIQDVTNGVTLLSGITGFSPVTGGLYSPIYVIGVVSFDDVTDIQFQRNCQTARAAAANPWGSELTSSSWGIYNVFGSISLWKIE